MFINYLVNKKHQEKEEKRAMRMRRESEATGGKLSNVQGVIEKAIELTENDPNM